MTMSRDPQHLADDAATIDVVPDYPQINNREVTSRG
jgi:hypothetical protein